MVSCEQEALPVAGVRGGRVEKGAASSRILPLAERSLTPDLSLRAEFTLAAHRAATSTAFSSIASRSPWLAPLVFTHSKGLLTETDSAP